MAKYTITTKKRAQIMLETNLLIPNAGSGSITDLVGSMSGSDGL